MEHIHCLICGKPYEYDPEEDETPIRYICNSCTHTLPGDYILYRLECAKHGLYKKEFALLEWRLTWGQDKPLKFSNNEEVFEWK